MVSILEIDEVVSVLHHGHEIGRHRLISLPVVQLASIFEIKVNQQLSGCLDCLAELPANAENAAGRISDSRVESVLTGYHGEPKNKLGDIGIVGVKSLSQRNFSTVEILCRKTKQGQNAITNHQGGGLITQSQLEPDSGHRDASFWHVSGFVNFSDESSRPLKKCEQNQDREAPKW
ncbi:MAG: hypothetical protein KA435_14275 [Azonexus sp.]|nr:hypothetical protein [Azonexus sp.]MBP6204203.1 hypothetical protein [Azonexus sp.]